MTMSRDGQYVVLGTDGGRTELWRVHELEPVHAFPMCDAPIRSLCFTHDNKCDPFICSLPSPSYDYS